MAKWHDLIADPTDLPTKEDFKNSIVLAKVVSNTWDKDDCIYSTEHSRHYPFTEIHPSDALYIAVAWTTVDRF